jgi:hypothetical protein
MAQGVGPEFKLQYKKRKEFINPDVIYKYYLSIV